MDTCTQTRLHHIHGFVDVLNRRVLKVMISQTLSPGFHSKPVSTPWFFSNKIGTTKQNLIPAPYDKKLPKTAVSSLEISITKEHPMLVSLLGKRYWSTTLGGSYSLMKKGRVVEKPTKKILHGVLVFWSCHFNPKNPLISQKIRTESLCGRNAKLPIHGSSLCGTWLEAKFGIFKNYPYSLGQDSKWM